MSGTLILIKDKKVVKKSYKSSKTIKDENQELKENKCINRSLSEVEEYFNNKKLSI